MTTSDISKQSPTRLAVYALYVLHHKGGFNFDKKFLGFFWSHTTALRHYNQSVESLFALSYPKLEKKTIEIN